jgi:hypothetical protein
MTGHEYRVRDLVDLVELENLDDQIVLRSRSLQRAVGFILRAKFTQGHASRSRGWHTK